MIDGYLAEHRMKKLVDLGLDIERLYSESPQRYWLCMKTRPVTKKEINEDIDGDIDENSTVLLDEKVVIKDKGTTPRDTKNTHYYLTIPCHFLIEFLSDRLIGGFKIDCLYPEVDRAFLPYKRIEYMDKQKKQVFETIPPKPFSLEELLFEFISFLLVNKKYLIDISFFDYA